MRSAIAGTFLVAVLLLIISALPWRCPASSNQAPTTVNLSEKIEFNWPPAPVEGQKDFFTIAENGRARCAIVVPSNAKAEEKQAAAMLQLYLRLATQATNNDDFKVYTEKEIIPGDFSSIHIGETEDAKKVALDIPNLKYGGYGELPNVNGCLIKTVSSNILVLRGVTPPATVFAVVGLLKRYVGVRRYWPGEPGGIGDVVPRQVTLTLPKIEWRDWPYFISRIMSGTDNRGPGGELSKTTRFCDFWRLYCTIPNNESYYRLMKAQEHTNEPDLFPLIDGKRFVPDVTPGKPFRAGGWQPCVSNPKAAQIMAETIKETFRNKPQQIGEALSVNDGYGDCGCAACYAMDAPGANLINRVGLCDRYIKFDNQVAEMVSREFPDRILAFIAYGSMSSPPQTVKLHPMLLPVLCMSGNAYQMWDAWQKTGARHMGMYLYHDDGGFVIPKFDLHHSAKKLRYFVESGRARQFYHAFYGIYPLDGMVGYIQAELTWDPRMDEDALLDEYYRNFYRGADKSMRAFYETVEGAYEGWLEQAGSPHPYGKDINPRTDCQRITQFAVLPVSTALKAQKYLGQALETAKGDGEVRERVHLVKTIFDFATLGTRMYWAGERIKGSLNDSLTVVQSMVADAQEAVDSGLAFAAYKFDVMEKTPIKFYANHAGRGCGFDQFYADIHAGSIHPIIFGVIIKGFDSASAYLRKSLGAERAVSWWQKQRAAETRPILKGMLNMAICMAGGEELPNLVNDPGFEERGAKKLEPTGAESIILDGETHDGLNLWHRDGTPFNWALTNETAHSGKYAVVFWNTQYGGVGESVSVKNGDVLRISVWIKQNDKPSDGFLEISARGGKDGTQIRVPLQWHSGGWRQMEVFFPVPAGAQSVNSFVNVSGQTPGARTWVDDFFVGKYPN